MMKHTIITLILIIPLVFTLQSCRTEEKPMDTTFQLNFDGLPTPHLPIDNALNTATIDLGRHLFYEKKMSEDGTLSCASCHRQEHAFSDTNQFSLGVKKLPGKRQAMAIFNMAWNSNGFFWDGRATTLREQSLMPIQDHLEMNESISNVVSKLKNETEYIKKFSNAFENGKIDSVNISLALEQFMFTIVSNQSKYDLVKSGKAQFTDKEKKGHDLFFTSYNPDPNSLPKGADCFSCHSGANFENDLYMNNGLDSDIDQTDLGRQNVFNNPNLKAKFKVPSLRNIALTYPYMHDGRMKTLAEVIDHYNTNVKYSATVNPTLMSIQNNGGLNLTEEEKEALLAFLETLSDFEVTSNPKFGDPN
ncbi:MAG: cytochrome-c peroxidase [Flavobacteriales bacterium]